ncbi:hypothetical protein INT46_009009 [Mucor plumbeus]|uniref:Uncharacterized protein n=1 Tax=Mucor plumbeus TaxID=97098 RepID=A0A8H7QXY3_9FUNG|nr:hypothetical protein INT46_009009 [Mucor plumbeus]
MGFLNFRRKTKTNKALTPLPVVTTDLKNGTTDPKSNYHSPIANSFMMIGSSISDIAQSSLSEDIFNELIPSSLKNHSSTESRDTIRHSLHLKSNNNNITASNLPLKINKTIDSNSSSIDNSSKSALSESILSSSTRSSKQSDSSDSSLSSLSSTEEFLSLHSESISNLQDCPINSSKKVSENVPLINLLYRLPSEQQKNINATATATTLPELTIARMKERHRQEYHQSMQWSPVSPSSSTPLVNYHKKRADLSDSHGIYPKQLSPVPINSRVQMPLNNQIKSAIPTRSASSNIFTSDSFYKRPLVTSISRTNQPLNYQQTRRVIATIAVTDNRGFRNDKNNQQCTKPIHCQVEKMNAEKPRNPRQRLVNIAEYQQQQQQQQYFSNNIEPSKASKFKPDNDRIVHANKRNFVPDLVNLPKDNSNQKQEEKASTHCSHHQPHYTLTKRRYNNSCCQQKQHHQMIRCHHYNHNHNHNHNHSHNHNHKKPVICHNLNKCCQT